MREGLQKIAPADDTIVAISTPHGRSALGMVRMSGPGAVAIADRFFHSRSPLEHRLANFGRWRSPEGDLVDDVVITFFASPQSYTGEDVVEISGHGNPMVLGRILSQACAAGARLALPGEFTLRAVAHGKMDLIQAEAVREFIESQTEQQARVALRQMEGALSKRLQPLKSVLVDVIARMEAGIDFAEDDVDPPASVSILPFLEKLKQSLEDIQSGYSYGRILSEGLRLAILGKPNVGKSSLFNRLVSADRAIVTDIPGTTRDVVTETVSVDGIPLRLSDTAGVRDTVEHVESIGVGRALETVAGADLVLLVLDGSRPIDIDDERVLAKASSLPCIVIINKTDLPPAVNGASPGTTEAVRVSARTGAGVNDLMDRIRQFVVEQRPNGADDSILTSRRQYTSLLEASAALSAAIRAVSTGIPHEMALLDLYAALAALNELTGEVVTEDILDRIFSTFCIGK